MNANTTHTLIVIPCAAAKVDHAAPAAELYASANFALMLKGAQAEAVSTERELGTPARVMILSALHGLLELDTVVAPYDVKMDEAHHVPATTVAAQLRELNPVAVVTMLPKAYNAVLSEARDEIHADEDAAWISLYEAFDAAPAIGYQRGVASSLVRNADLTFDFDLAA